MNLRAIGAAVFAVPVIITVGVAIIATASGTLTPTYTVDCTTPLGPEPSEGAANVSSADLDAAQLSNARIIYTVAAQRRLPHRAGVIAIATVLQESMLRNLTVAVNHDSLGLFQQRPSQGWGTPAQILNPVYASNAFYDRLIQVPGWQTMPLTKAAQAVQRSGLPDAYAKWEWLATELAGSIANSIGTDGVITVSCAAPNPNGWVRPLAAPVGSGFRTPSRPTHNGVDLSARRGTTIVAASAGTVAIVKCDTKPASWGCNRDGDPVAVRGCGWYVDIRHAGDVITRYCHMNTKPAVVVGQQVQAGQPIGIVGTTGHSSGPHLHFEVHLGSHSSASAVDPVPFMQRVGAPLGP